MVGLSPPPRGTGPVVLSTPGTYDPSPPPRAITVLP